VRSNVVSMIDFFRAFNSELEERDLIDTFLEVPACVVFRVR